MNPDTLKSEIRELIMEISEIDDLPETKKFSDLGIDSMMGVEIVTAIERKYQIKIPETELEQVSTLQSSVDLVAQKIAAK